MGTKKTAGMAVRVCFVFGSASPSSPPGFSPVGSARSAGGRFKIGAEVRQNVVPHARCPGAWGLS